MFHFWCMHYCSCTNLLMMFISVYLPKNVFFLIIVSIKCNKKLFWYDLTVFPNLLVRTPSRFLNNVVSDFFPNLFYFWKLDIFNLFRLLQITRINNLRKEHHNVWKSLQVPINCLLINLTNKTFALIIEDSWLRKSRCSQFDFLCSEMRHTRWIK